MPTLPLATPDMYKTSVIMPALENLPAPSEFLRQKLFSRTFTTTADQIDARTYLGNSRVAPYCSRFSKGHAVARAPEQLTLLSPPASRIQDFRSDGCRLRVALGQRLKPPDGQSCRGALRAGRLRIRPG
jgi:hypothetical protein